LHGFDKTEMSLRLARGLEICEAGRLALELQGMPLGHQDAPLPWIFMERVTIELTTLLTRSAAAATLQSDAESRPRGFLE
jgi:hypothetical protein